MTIPDDWRERAPAMTEGAWRGLSQILQHRDAPRWNRTIGDRVGAPELEALEAFRGSLDDPLEAGWAPSSKMIDRVESLRGQLLGLEDLPRGFDVARDFEELPTTSREDIVRRLELWVPKDADLEEAIVYSTSGTTGHPVVVPSHPRAMVKNLAHLERLAALHRRPIAPEEGLPFALNVSAQQRTYVFACANSGWGGAVFAKINLGEHDWAGGAAACHRFCADFAPELVASEPITMAEMVRRGLPVSPKIIVSSAVQLPPSLSQHVAEATGAAVVDLYSSTETGPIAASVPGVEGHVVLLPDVYVEVVDALGDRLPDGARGEICVTGGRNPFFPLLRYRTGDHGRLTTAMLPDGRRARVIVDLEGRAPVRFQAQDGRPVTAVDVARTIRPLGAYVQHQLTQRADRSVELRLRPIPDVPIALEAMEHALREIFGRGAVVSVVVDPDLGRGEGKPEVWRSELSLS